jgi:RNA polymerase-binding transcription factor DksA
MNDIETLQQRLLDEQKVLHKELVELGIQNKEVPQDWIATPEEPALTEADENVIADRTEEWIERRAEVAELETRYNNVFRAVMKIKNGTYGVCEICQATIESDRLSANPAARTCKAHLNDESQLSL